MGGAGRRPVFREYQSDHRQAGVPDRALASRRDADQFDYWKHTQLIIDVVPGRGHGFTLEAPEGLRFLTRSRVFTDEETDALARA
jgi:uncharacterized protein (DUF779 family)